MLRPSTLPGLVTPMAWETRYRGGRQVDSRALSVAAGPSQIFTKKSPKFNPNEGGILLVWGVMIFGVHRGVTLHVSSPGPLKKGDGDEVDGFTVGFELY